MKSRETKQSQQGQVSARPGEDPKDENQNTYTEEETQLAAKYHVEPKTVKLIAEIVAEHFAEPKQAETQDQTQEQEKPSTGIPYLDELIQSATYPAIAMAYTCLQASWINNELGDKLSATLRSGVNELLEKHRKGKQEVDAECEVLPAMKWLAFLKGLRVRDGQKTESLRTTEKQPKKATPITVLQDWLSKRSYTEKLTAVLLWQLINKEDIYKKEGYCEGSIGNELFREYEQAVVEASQDKEYLTKAAPEEVSVTGLVTGLLPMRV